MSATRSGGYQSEWPQGCTGFDASGVASTTWGVDAGAAAAIRQALTKSRLSAALPTSEATPERVASWWQDGRPALAEQPKRGGTVAVGMEADFEPLDPHILEGAHAGRMVSFRSGRDFATWVGLTPKQRSTGGKPRLGKTSKMGQLDIRRLLIIGASANARGFVVRASVRLICSTPRPAYCCAHSTTQLSPRRIFSGSQLRSTVTC